MKKFSVLFAVLFTLGLAACGDDPADPSDTGGSDAGGDTGGGDAGGDTGEDTGDDTGTDTDPGDVPDTDTGDDTETGPTPEICDNGVDDSGNGLIDCDDPECAGVLACTDEICDNEEDDNGNGLVDCFDPDCVGTPECTVECDAPEVERGGICVTPDFDETEDDAFGNVFSYIRGLSIPPRNTDAECCFDISGNGRVDNGLALLVGALGVLGGDIDIEATLEDALAEDDIALLMGWNDWPTEAGFSVLLATNDVDGDGAPDQEFDVRLAGDGVFQVQAESFDEFGALVQFNVAEVTDGMLRAGPSQFRLNIPIDAGDFTLDLDLTIEQARIEGGVADHANGVASVDETFDIDGEDVEFGGLKLGGVVPLDQIFSLIDDLARDCECAGFDTTQPVISYGDDGTQYAVECSQSPGGGCTEEDGVICENIALVCSFLPSLPSLGLNDIDTDGNGVGDALSVGIRLSATGAVLADPPVAE